MTLLRRKPQLWGHIQFVSILLVCCLVIFSCANRKNPAPVYELYQGKTYKNFKREGYVGETYQVQAGDTLFSIAWYSGSDYRDLAKINNISAPYHIYPGQRLSLITRIKPLQPKLPPKSGQTSKTITNQAVDPPKKQAYGESEQIMNKGPVGSTVGRFPNHIVRWSWPTARVVSRGFSAKDDGNNGLDFLGNRGEPIWAAADGKVVYTGDALRGFGKLVIVKHSEDYLTAYAHNDTVLVKEQQWIKSGDKIATMGMSGTDKVKLHFEVRYKGKSINPLRYLPKR